MDMLDFSFMDNEDFGLAKSFSTAPICALAPQYAFNKKDQIEVEEEATHALENELISDGFCFKMAPCQDVSCIDC